jgi:ADP-ribose pyrophosphatase YjhB (NUDIX family)
MKLSFSDSYLGKLRAIVGHRPLIVPGFRIIIEDGAGKILFIKRSDNGMWGLPAGSPELGESLEDCIRREVFEETSLSITSFDCFGCASNPLRETHTYPNGDQIQNFSFLIYSKEWSGKPATNDDETTEVLFRAPNELPPKELILQHEFASIALYESFKRSGQFQWS